MAPMTPDSQESRKLAAIMFTDMVGYSALAQRNESLALALLQTHRQLLRPVFPRHGGTEIETIGEAFFVEFGSALQAVECAIDIQKSLLEYDRSASPELQIQVRIGVHAGDVVHMGKNVHGDEVNIAARLYPLASPGGIVVTEDVWRQIKHHPNFSFVSLGSRHLKGILTPIKVFALSGEGLVVPSVKQRVSSLRSFKRSIIGAVAAVIALTFYLTSPLFRSMDPEEVPSIAILYLKNLGLENDDRYSYGITQDLIVDIAKAGWVRVAAMKDILPFRTSTMPLDS